MIIGYSHIVDFFTTAARENRLAHAYGFVGTAQLGKRTVARTIAAELLHTSVEHLDRHPDFYYVERLEDEKTGKLKKDITVAQARELKQRLGRTAWGDGKQVVILDEAELLNEEAGNALLKILEEPGKNSILFLLTEDDSRLLPTIRSRVPLCYFEPLPETILAEGLKVNGVSETKVQEVLPMAWGRPGRAMQFLAEPERQQWYEKEYERIRDLRGSAFYSKVAALEEMIGKHSSDTSDSVRDRERLKEILDIWIMEGDVRLRQKKEKAVARQLEELFEAKRWLGRNIHPRLLLEKVLLTF